MEGYHIGHRAHWAVLCRSGCKETSQDHCTESLGIQNACVASSLEAGLAGVGSESVRERMRGNPIPMGCGFCNVW